MDTVDTVDTARDSRALPTLVSEKLAAFDRLQPEFEASFQLIVRMHGGGRFASLPVADIVHYLHALWVCECKDRLLSVPGGVERYQGARGLAVLRRWLERGQTAELVAFLCDKLDTLDVAQLSRQLETEQQANGDSVFAQRLAHGRLLVVNRGMNLLHALDPLFTRPAATARDEALAAAAEYGHTSEQIEEQLRLLGTPPYSYVRHPALAQRNMREMIQLGIGGIAMAEQADGPASHVWRAAQGTMPAGPFAEQTIKGYVLLRAPWHNNPLDVRWVDRAEPLAMPAVGWQTGDVPPA